MACTPERIPVYLEVGEKRAFAGAIDWPGWCVSARDPESALQAMFEAGPRYAAVVAHSDLGFTTPDDVGALKVVERLEGTKTTDFGAPDVAPESDARPVAPDDLRRLETMLRAAWRAFDAAVDTARGNTLRKGPRGGGRDLDAIVRHVIGGEAGYLGALGWKFRPDEKGDVAIERQRTRDAVMEGLAASVAGEIAAVGPRGGRRWRPRYFVRRTAWHAVEHTWEIEDRSRSTEGRA